MQTGIRVRFFIPWIGYKNGVIISVDDTKHEALVLPDHENEAKWIGYERLTVLDP